MLKNSGIVLLEDMLNDDAELAKLYNLSPTILTPRIVLLLKSSRRATQFYFLNRVTTDESMFDSLAKISSVARDNPDERIPYSFVSKKYMTRKNEIRCHILACSLILCLKTDILSSRYWNDHIKYIKRTELDKYFVQNVSDYVNQKEDKGAFITRFGKDPMCPLFKSTSGDDNKSTCSFSNCLAFINGVIERTYDVKIMKGRKGSVNHKDYFVRPPENFRWIDDSYLPRLDIGFSA